MTSRASFFNKMFKPGKGAGDAARYGFRNLHWGAKRIGRGAASLFKAQPAAAKIVEGGVGTYLAAEHFRKKQENKAQQNYLNPYQL